MSSSTIALFIAVVVVIGFIFFVLSVPPTRSRNNPLVSRIETIDAVGDYQGAPIGVNALRKVASRQESEIRTHNLTSAKAIHERNNVVRAEALQISVESLKAMEVVKFKTDEEIRK